MSLSRVNRWLVAVVMVCRGVMLIGTLVRLPGVADPVPDCEVSAGCGGQKGRHGQEYPEVQAIAH